MARRVDPATIALTLDRARLEPLQAYPGNSTPWLCRCLVCGEEVTPTWSNLQRGQGGCRFCAGSDVPPAVRLRVMRDGGANPTEPYPGRNNLPWRSDCLQCGRQIAPVYSNVQRGQRACKYCAKRGVETSEAEQVMRDAGLQPIEPYPGSGSPWRCICTRCGADTSPRYGNIRSGQGGCAACAGKLPDLDAVVAEMKRAGVTPLQPYPGANTPWLSRCVRCRRTVTPRLGNIRIGQGACKFCAQVAVDPDDAARRMVERQLLPLVPYPGSGEPWRCECIRCGREVSPRWDDVKAGGGGCLYCAPNAAIDPDAASHVMTDAGATPLDSFPGSNRPWRCRCETCGRTVSPTFASVRGGSAPCGFCSGHRVDAAEAVRVMNAAGLRPMDPYPGSDVPWRSHCEVCRNEVTPRWSNVRHRGRGCIFCAAWGTDYSAPSVLYLIEDPSRGVRKIGIAGLITTRLAIWRRRGWTVSNTWNFPTGADAYRIEQAVITWWRHTLGLPSKVRGEDGWTETVDAGSVASEQVVDYVNHKLLPAKIPGKTDE